MSNEIIGIASKDMKAGEIFEYSMGSEPDILYLAIGQAIKNGWIPPWSPSDVWDDVYYPPETIIFNHNFAKALWGEEWSDAERYILPPLRGENSSNNKLWQYHLQQMVIADNPIKYLGEHI